MVPVDARVCVCASNFAAVSAHAESYFHNETRAMYLHYLKQPGTRKANPIIYPLRICNILRHDLGMVWEQRSLCLHLRRGGRGNIIQVTKMFKYLTLITLMLYWLLMLWIYVILEWTSFIKFFVTKFAIITPGIFIMWFLQMNTEFDRQTKTCEKNHILVKTKQTHSWNYSLTWCTYDKH